jgi:hypothetical protein
MRTSTAYFAGAGTVVAAIVAGLGGGLLFANIVHPTTPKQGTETTHLERRMQPAPIQTTTAASEPVPYLVAPQPAAPVSVAAAPTAPATSGAPANPAADTVKAAAPAGSAEPSPTPAAPPSTAAAQGPRAVAPDDAGTKPREADVRRDADAKPAVDKHKFERRRQWADRRRYPRRHEQELDAVEQSVREETEPRRELAVEPAKIEMPQIRLFGPE